MTNSPEKHSRFNLEAALEKIASKANGCDEATVAYSLAYIICLASGKKFQNGHYCPDLSDKFCRFYDNVDTAMQEAWERFVNVGRDELLAEELDEIQSSGTSLSEYRKSFRRCLDRASGYRTTPVFREPKEVRDLVLMLLDYAKGPVYNPFAGYGAYGEGLNAGDNYYADEIQREIWGLGMINLILNRCPSDNFQNRLSPRREFADKGKEDSMTFDSVLCTVPFGMKVPSGSGSNWPSEDLMLSYADRLLSPEGKMVMVVPASMLNRGRQTMEIRREICKKGLLDTVIVLPRAIFSPYANIQTAVIVLSRQHEGKTAKLVDATDCIFRKSLNVDGVLERIENRNNFVEVDLKDLEERDYSWHFAKYEDKVDSILEEGHSKKQLSSFIVPTGIRSLPDKEGSRYISASELKSDPFSYEVKQEELPVLQPDSSSSYATLLHAKARADEYEAEILRLTDKQAELEKKYQEQKVLSAQSQSRIAREITERRAVIEVEIKQQVATLDMINRELQQLYRDEESNGPSSHTNSELNHWEDQEKEVKSKLDTLRGQLKELDRYNFSSKDIDPEFTAIVKERTELPIRITELTEKRNMALKQIQSLSSQDGTPKAKLIRKVVHSALFIGGNKPKVKFAYVDASPSSPVYIQASNCFAFKVDDSQIDLGYLVYLISTAEFKDLGERFQWITETDILGKYVDVIEDIEEQKIFVHDRELEVNPLTQKIEELKKQIQEDKDNFDEAIGYKKHEMGHRITEITNGYSYICNLILEHEKDVLLKEQIIRQMAILNDSIHGLSVIQEHLAETTVYAPGEKVNIKDYLEDYVDSVIPDGYSIELEIDDTSIDEEMGIYCSVNGDVLDSAIFHIRDNAKRHGFSDDPSRDDYKVIFVLSYDAEADEVIIDFINNGTPMSKGVDYALYSSPEGKAGEHAVSGKGGAYVCGMAKAYNGKCQINPEEVHRFFKVQTTIRIILPYCHE